MAGWLDRRARKRYARSFKDILAVRDDTRGIAVHLRKALPDYFTAAESDTGATGYTTAIHPAASLRDPQTDIALTAPEEMIALAAKMNGMVFWYTGPDPDRKRFTIIVTDDWVAAGLPDAVVDVPAFITGGQGAMPEDGSQAEAELAAERDCSE
jgi:hypothetical protein